jgi:Flp pilus assembly protein TadG
MGDRMNSKAGATVEVAESGSDQQRGAILPLMAIMLVVLIGTAAMAVDLGWLYWQSIEIQHGADAAALAGVVYEPDFHTEAHTEAIAAAAQNGFDDADAGTSLRRRLPQR